MMLIFRNKKGTTIADHPFLVLRVQSLDSTNICDAGNITVFFHQNIVALKPAISIGFEPARVRVIFNFTASPLIILSEVGGLRFYMTNSGNVDWAPGNGIDPDAVIPLDKFGMNATFNEEHLRNSPFQLKDWMFTLKVGVRLTGIIRKIKFRLNFIWETEPVLPTGFWL